MQTYSIKWNYPSYFLYKSRPVQSITNIVLLGFLLTLLPFISSNTTIYFFVRNFFFSRMFIFQWNDIRKHHVERITEIYLVNYFTSIFTEFFLYYCYCCCYCYYYCSSFLTKLKTFVTTVTVTVVGLLQ